MMESWLNWLPTWIVLSPLLGVAALLWIPREQTGWLKRVGLLGTLPPLVLVLILFSVLIRDPVRFNLSNR